MIQNKALNKKQTGKILKLKTQITGAAVAKCWQAIWKPQAKCCIAFCSQTSILTQGNQERQQKTLK